MQILAVKFSVWLQIIVYPSHTPQSSFTLWKHFCLSVQCNDQLSSYPLSPLETSRGMGGGWVWEEQTMMKRAGVGGGGGGSMGWGGVVAELEEMKWGKENYQHSNVVRSTPNFSHNPWLLFFFFLSESLALKSLN